jgi:hypothetical protein
MKPLALALDLHLHLQERDCTLGQAAFGKLMRETAVGQYAWLTVRGEQAHASDQGTEIVVSDRSGVKEKWASHGKSRGDPLS